MEAQELILEKIRKTIKTHHMIRPGDGIVAGLSGGPDSVCLFHALCMLKDSLQIGDITAVHINHCLRGAESDGDEAYAAELARRMGAEIRVFRYDVKRIAEETGEGTEAAGRRLRYQAFEQVRQEKGAARIAVAHNRNDQAETVLMRIMRGTGLRGLRGIDPVREDGRVIRPVLALSRAEIEAYCAGAGLQPRIDSTNSQEIYTRNKIRLRLLPLMEREFNPNITSALVRLGDQAREDDSFLMEEAEAFLRNEENRIGSGEENRASLIDEKSEAPERGSTAGRWNSSENSLLLAGFSELHPAVAKRVLLACARRAGMEQNMSALHLDALMALADPSQEARQTDLSDGYIVRHSYGKLWFVRRTNSNARGACGGDQEPEAGISVPVPLPAEALEREGRAVVQVGNHVLKLQLLVPPGGGGLWERNSGEVFLDYDRLLEKPFPVFRFRRAGDRIRPRGMKGSKKLQDFFTDRKIPRHLRDETVLLVWENHVILAGKEVSEECAVREDTKRILSIES
ncbi:MAG: tRNA lysidine(34) synthetase TilS [Anaerovoracaceae bacterium]